MARVGRLLQFARYYSAFYDDTFHTAFPELESPSLLSDYVFEGAGRFYLMFENPDPNVGATVPVYRFWNPTLGDHYHTVQSSVGGGYIFEGVVGYVYGSSGPNRRAMYSFVKSGVTAGGRPSINHYASIDPVPFPGYTSEGLAWYSPIIVEGCYDTRASNYNVYVNQASTGCLYPPPSISFSLSPTSICRGSISTLSWSVSGLVDSISIDQGIGTVGTSGSRLISPLSTTTYNITASGLGGTNSSQVTLTVKQPSTVSLTLDSDFIISGQSTTLRWATTGEVTSATITPGIGSVNLNGNRTVSPTETVTYEIYIDGECQDSYDSVTLNVYSPPSVEFSGPESLLYGQQGTLFYEVTNADLRLEVIPTYNYKTGSVLGNVVNLPTGDYVSGTIQTQIPYTEQGPISIYYIIVAMGRGGQESKQIDIPIIIDETPDNFLVPESEELFKSQDPVVTPDATLTSYEIIVQDIDVPVEVKADKPILVEVNDDEVWNKIRRIQ